MTRPQDVAVPPATKAAARIREALEAGPTPEWKRAREPNGRGNGWSAGPDAWLGSDAYSTQTAAAAAYIAACSPDSLRALLAERDEQRGVIAELLDQMHHFANADQRLWDESQRDPKSFKSWVRSRAAHLLAKFTDRAALTNKD